LARLAPSAIRAQGILSLAVALPGDPIRHSVFAMGASKPEDWEAGGELESQFGVPAVQTLFHRAAHTIHRAFDCDQMNGNDVFNCVLGWSCFLFRDVAEDRGVGEVRLCGFEQCSHQNGAPPCAHSAHRMAESVLTASVAALEQHPIKALTYCAHCYRTPNAQRPLKSCGQCKAVRYCSTECQRAAWRGGHKQVCVAAAAEAGDSERN
jgi:hypothetical protein